MDVRMLEEVFVISETATKHRWTELSQEEVAPGIIRAYLTGERVTVARFTLAAGAIVPTHKHDQEQISSVLRGALRFTIGAGEGTIVRAGEVIPIPPGAEHGVVAVEDSEVIDVFCPIRQDWLDRTDTYFKK